MKEKKEAGKISISQIVLVFFSLAFLIFYLFRVDGVSALPLLLNIQYAKYIFLAAACMLLYWLSEGVVLYLSLRSSSVSLPFFSVFRITMIGQYFNVVTPFSAGGQPSQAYYLHKKGISYSQAVSGLFSKFLIYQLTLTVYCLCMVLLRFTVFREEYGSLVYMSLIGFAVQVGVSFALLSIAFFKKGTTAVISFVFRFLGKFKIFRKITEKKANVFSEIESFHEQCMMTFRDKKRLFLSFLMTVVQLSAYYIIGYLLHLCFRQDSVDFLTIISSQTFIVLIGSFIPTPGGVGTAEGSFYLFFQTYFPSSVLSLVIFLWRALTFYFPLLTGLFFVITEKRKNLKTRGVLLSEDGVK